MSDFIAKFQQDFIESDRYLYLLRGLGNTLLIAALAVIWELFLDFWLQSSGLHMTSMAD